MRRSRFAAALAGLGGVGVVVLAAIVGTVIALTGASLACPASASADSSGAPAGPAPTPAALATIPAARLVLYVRAGRRFDIDWTVLASIGTQECNNDGCAGDNGSGCEGPMQIAAVPYSPCSPGPGPTLFQRYGVSASGGTPDVNDPADAIFTAARILRFDKGAPPAGGSYQAYYQGACRYYGACADALVAYAQQVMTRAVQFGFNGPGTPNLTTQPVAITTPSVAPPGCGMAQPVGLSPGGGSQIVRIAQSQVGQGEHPDGSNCTIYGPCEEWCGLFVAWVWQHAGIALPGPTATWGYSGSLYTWAQAHGRVLPPSAIPAPGDAVFYGTGPNDSVHVGLVEQVLPGGLITTIEGNDNNHVQRNGPFLPSQALAAGEPAPIYGYAQPPTTPTATPAASHSRA